VDADVGDPAACADQLGAELRATIGAQAFAVLGVLVGLFTIAVGVGPRTVPDVAYHLGILAVLVAGLTSSASGDRHGGP
jgi:hypothetical protein